MQYRSLVLNIEFWDLGSPDSRQKTVTVTLYSKNPLNTFTVTQIPYRTKQKEEANSCVTSETSVCAALCAFF